MEKKRVRWIVLVVLVLSIWVAGWSTIALLLLKRDSSLSHATNDGRGYEVRFGILGTDSAGNDFLSEETTTIPLKYKASGFRYGLEIVAPDDNPFTYQCVFHFSTAPKIITGSAFDSSAPSATMRTPKTQAQGSAVENYWFDPGDPVGDESVDVFINDKLVKTIKYTVVPEN